MEPALVAVMANALTPARTQMALSLGSHIVLACFGMAMPAMIFVLHRRGLRGDEHALELAKRWSKIASVLFAIGAVSGTILSFEMGLLWPGLMERFGDVLGLAFALEGLSFFIEAIFLGIYVYGWGRLPGRLHSLMLVPIMAAGVAGSFFVVSVNAWMNAPAGFTLDATGRVTDVDPLRAIFNDAVWLQFLHMFLAAYMVTGFVIASIYAVGILRRRTADDAASASSDDGTRARQRLGLLVPLAFALVATPIQPVVGHFAGQRLADGQPIKLAAIEGLSDTESGVPVVLGGFFDDGRVRGGIEVPIHGLGSFLATNDRDGVLVGLSSVEPADRPPVNIVRWSFQVMVGIGTALVALAVWFAIAWQRGRYRVTRSRGLMSAVALAGPASIVAMEAGWVTTEVGRQPWVVHQVLRTEDAVTDSGFIWVTLTVLVLVYIAMGVAAVGVLRSMGRRWASGESDLASPYGPMDPALDDEPELVSS